MSQSFKYLRILTAIVLLISVVFSFAADVILQSKGLLDGPLAHHISVTFAINKIIFAVFLALVLILDFDIRLPKFGKTILLIVGGTCLLLSVIGFVYLLRNHSFYGWKMMGWEFYLFQAAFMLISIIIIAKGLSADWTPIDEGDDPNA